MQALRNKFNGKSKRRSTNNQTNYATPLDPLPSNPSAVVTDYNETHRDLDGAHVDEYHKTEVSSLPQNSSSFSSMDSSIPIPPPMPPVDFWKSGDSSRYAQFFSSSSDANSVAPAVFPMESSRTMENLPVEVIERPIIIHESIRREQIEEIQSVVQVEREKTEIRQITQPIVDKEVKPVFIEERTLAVEVLPTIIRDAAPMPERFESSTQSFDGTMRQVVEKTPIIQETEKWRIIEEIQPVIYREVIVPHLIRTSRPMREVIVEAPIFTEHVYASRQLTATERERYSSFFSKETVPRQDMPASSFPIRSIPATGLIRVVPEVAAPMPAPMPALKPAFHEIKETLEKVITTTTTNTIAPTIGSQGGSSSASTSTSGATVSEPVVLGRTHDVKFGPMGETIVKDTVTTTSQVFPTRAN